MKNFFLNRQLKRIERDANDHLMLLLEVSPEYYTTKELVRLLRELQLKKSLVYELKRRLLVIGASISVWIAAAFLSQTFSLLFVSYFFLALIPFALLGFIGGSIYVSVKYKFFNHAPVIEKIIKQELDRRRKESSIF
ncbi:MAG: hypothetical protein AAF798_00610 [Bacteroidota bacterium]